MHHHFLPELEERFLRYVRIHTASEENSPTSPSTPRQFELLSLLADELRAIGAHEVRLTDYGALLATIPAHETGQAAPTVAFLAHVDTYPGFSGEGVKPIVHRNWDGQAIVLPDDPSLVLSSAVSPNLGDKIGHDLVTASGTTLLGADDKAGVAIVMAMASHLLQDRDIPHGRIRLCFTPDEEIGRGVHARLPADLAADVAYTLDGGNTGALCFESFSADKAVITIAGVSTHTGTAKGKMVNALTLAGKLLGVLPQHTLTPETTDGRQGFIHCYQCHGTMARAELHFILRDFELDGLAAHGQVLQQACLAIAAGEPRAAVTCTITPQYRNMRYWLEKDLRPVELARAAYRQAGIEPVDEPIRGGTDGSRLTEMGLPTPNLFTGMHEVHGPLEWVSLQDMAKATEMCIALARLWGGAEADDRVTR